MSRFKEFFAGKPFAGEKNTRKKLFLALFISILLVAAIIGVVAGVKSRKENPGQSASIKISAAHAIAKSSCSSTLYPELCYSAIADSLDDSKKVKSVKDVIILSLNVTIEAEQRNFFAIKKLLANGKSNLTEREKTALHDCLETIDETLHELHTAIKDLSEYPFKKSIEEHADDLKTLLSSAIINQETCLDRFSHGKADKHAREVLVGNDGATAPIVGARAPREFSQPLLIDISQLTKCWSLFVPPYTNILAPSLLVGGQVLRVEKLCSNSLAMLENMTDIDIAKERNLNGARRKLLAAEGWPEWLSAGDKRLLQSSSMTPDVVVAADGGGDHRTVATAVVTALERSSRRYVIRIKAGVYRENVEVPKKKTNIMLLVFGDSSILRFS